MNNIEPFYLLKQKILEKYRQHYPYFTGRLHDFGNQEIAHLIDLIETECKERVSEKWVYTHLKPVQNEKLPRKDMLNIFSCWVGYSGWEEFIYKQSTPQTETVDVKPEKKNNKLRNIIYMGISILFLAVVISIGYNISSENEATVCLKDKYTQKVITEERVTLYKIKNSNKEKLPQVDECFIIKSGKDTIVLVAESPYYKTDTLKVVFDSDITRFEYDLQPDDYAMMLRAYMNANIEGWNKRRKQLNEILDDNAVIQEVMFEDIGVEFLNKQEFIDKITTPSKLVKQMEVIDIEYKEGKIISLKYMQKE